MLKNPAAPLDYFKLVKQAKRLQPAAGHRKLRVAVLGDCATQQVVTLTRVLCHQAGINAELFEAGYDTLETEIFNPTSDLYAFAPEVVVLLNTTQALRQRYYNFVGEKTGFAAATLERCSGLWQALRQQTQALIIQSNFPAPFERLFGNYDLRVEGSLTDAVQVINRGLAEQSRQQKNVAINDVDAVASYVGRGAWFDEKLWILAKSPCALEFLPALVQNAVDIMAASQGQGVKCVVLDLDNTLWGGVIGDDGLEGIRLGHFGDGEGFTALQCFLKELKSRGILLAVCSKNDHVNAIKPFREHSEMVLKEDDITVFVANWDNKAQNIATIKQTLNIGYDSMVFLDDNPFERNLVREMLPEVIVPELPEDPADYVKTISALNLFETASFSALDRQRAEMYAQEAKREGLKHSFTNVEDYLASLHMKMLLGRFDTMNLPRIAQLIQRSNQFNLCTRRYNEAQCEAMMRDQEGYYPMHISLSDKLGDHGLISVVVLRNDVPGRRLFIDEYLMSCRVLQRGVEQSVMNEIFAYARTRGAEVVEGSYLPTAKNAMVKEFYARFGFEKVAEDDKGNARWVLPVARYVPQAAHIARVAVASGAPASDGEAPAARLRAGAPL
jgi:FkbH-like protein